MLINAIAKYATKPPVYTPGDKELWTDPHIASQMLKYHLDPEVEAASRKHEEIDRAAKWIVDRLNLGSGATLLDLGCGPGLYATRFASHGQKVTGMDFSKNSIEHARGYALEHGLDIHYIHQNYLTMDYNGEFDTITLIYCDLGVLSAANRDMLLQRIHTSLKPGGRFVFDVFSTNRRQPKETSSWEYAPISGFYLPIPHVVLENTFYYPEERAFLDQYIVIDEESNVDAYRVWDTVYTPESITQVLEAQGFAVDHIYGDLCGSELAEGSPVLGVVCTKI